MNFSQMIILLFALAILDANGITIPSGVWLGCVTLLIIIFAGAIIKYQEEK